MGLGHRAPLLTSSAVRVVVLFWWTGEMVSGKWKEGDQNTVSSTENVPRTEILGSSCCGSAVGHMVERLLATAW